MKCPKPDIEDWPEPLSKDARHGLAGRFLEITEPHTEADPAALHVQFLAAIGNVIGKGPHFYVEATRHGLNLFVAVVGASSKARKGTSWGHVKSVIHQADETWPVQTGLSSGEGLIHSVRDGGSVSDKRAFVIESEFASLLRSASRNGNTLSAIVRQAWDGDVMQIMTKQSPITATDAHISIVGHITHSELKKELTSTDSQNGFANRFLWLCVTRSQLLPNGGRVPQAELETLHNDIGEILTYWKSLGECELIRDEDAHEYWDLIYSHISGDRPEGYAAFVSRAEAQVSRLACIYAVLDCSKVIRLEHLRAAVAVWEYCEASARCLFEPGRSNPVEVKIKKALRINIDGVSRTEINRLFGGNRNASEIEQALANLSSSGSAEMRSSRSTGRPEQRWFALPDCEGLL